MAVVAAADVLDVAFFSYSPDVIARLASSGIIIEPCATPWSPFWERAPAPIADPDRYRGNRSAFVRRAAYTRADGRVVLQRTRTSSRDWEYGPLPTPGFVR
jgi:hypothetical protein